MTVTEHLPPPPPPDNTSARLLLPPLETWLEPEPVRVSRTSLRRLPTVSLSVIVAAAFIAQLSVRVGAATAVAALSITATAAVLIARPGLDQDTHAAARGAAGAAALFGLLLAWRASTWLTTLNLAVALTCLVGAALLRTGVPSGLTTGLVRTSLRRLWSGVEAPWIVVRSLRPQTDGALARALPLLRGVAIAAIPILILAALLASADAVFADVVSLDLRAEAFASHGLLTACAALGIVGLLAASEAPRHGESDRAAWLGAIEGLVVLAGVALLFGGFAVTQFASALGVADGTLARQGITEAEYARSGYFQLLWVAGLTAVLLTSIRMVVDTSSARLDRGARILGAIVCLLTVFIVGSAIVRLGLYTDAFGQTTLRWYSNAFAWLLGGAMLVAAAGHHPRVARVLPLTLISLTAVTLVVCNLVNPEARVARHNLDRVTDDPALELDVEYLTRLSSDAWPVLLEARSNGRVPDVETFDVYLGRCFVAETEPGWGPLGFNISRAGLDCAA